MHLKPLDVRVESLPSNTPPYVSRKTPKGYPNLHFLAAAIGSRNSGKTTAAIKFWRAYVLSKSFDTIFWFSPTASREDKTKDFVKFCDKHGVGIEVIDNYSDTVFAEKTEWIRREIDTYKQYERQLAVWERFVRVRSVDKLTMDELMELEAMGWERPTTTYTHGYPSFGIIIDDHAGRREVFNPSCKGGLASFCILHRHLSCSVMFLMQIHANGIARGLRSNISLWMLWGTKSATLKKAIAEEVAFKIDPELLIQAWDYATRESPHDFLYMNYDSPTLDGMFRKNFDQEIVFAKGNEDDATPAVP